MHPFWILQPRTQHRQTCLCIRHDNMQFLVDKLNFLGITKPANITQLCNSVCCNANHKECAYGECKQCEEKKISVLLDADTSSLSFYYKWTTQKQTRPSSNGSDVEVKITTKARISATGFEMVEEVNRGLPDFVKHVYRIHHQYEFIRSMKSTLAPTECLIHVDFSENYVCKFSKEAHSVHFGASRQQACMHTGVVYTRKRDEKGEQHLECTSFCTISDSTRHDPPAIWAHLKPVLGMIAHDHPQVCTIHFLSDGPSTQYKNRFHIYFFSQLPKFNQKFVSGSWSYCESGHGKGAADGIGGSLKRQADRVVAQGIDIPDPQTLYRMLYGKTITKLFFIKPQDISVIDALLENTTIKRIPSTMKIHQVIFKNLNCIETRYLSCSQCFQEHCMHHCINDTVYTIEPATGILLMAFNGKLVQIFC